MVGARALQMLHPPPRCAKECRAGAPVEPHRWASARTVGRLISGVLDLRRPNVGGLKPTAWSAHELSPTSRDTSTLSMRVLTREIQEDKDARPVRGGLCSAGPLGFEASDGTGSPGWPAPRDLGAGARP